MRSQEVDEPFAETPYADLARLVDEVDAVLWTGDPDTLRFTYVSGGAERMLGYPRSRWLEPGFWVSILHPGDRERTIAHVQRQTAAGLDHETRYRAIAADGRTVWLRDNSRIKCDHVGAVLRLHGVLFDITSSQARAVQHAAASHLGNLALTLPVAGFFDEVVRTLTQALEVDLVEIVEVDPERRRATTVAGWGDPPIGERRSVPIENGAWTGFVLAASGPVTTEDVDSETEFRLDDRLEGLGIKSAVGTGIGGTLGTPYGCMNAYSRSRRGFTADEAHFVGSVASIVASAATRAEVERELKRRENLLATAQDVAGLGSWEWQIASGQVWWSRELFEVHGQDPDCFEPSLESFLAIIAPEDLDRVRALVEHSLSTREPLEYDYTFVRGDGTRRIGYALARWMEDREGNPDRLIGTVQDITETREAEQRIRDSERRFRAIFDHAGLGMATVSPQGTIREANHAFHSMLGYSAGDLRGKHFAELTHSEDIQADLVLYEELLEGLREEYSLEKRFLRSDGVAVWGLLTATAVRDARGQPTMAVGMVQDITVAKQAVEDLMDSRAQLSAKSDELIRLTRRLVELQEVERRNIAHDLHDEVGQILTGLKLTLEAAPGSQTAGEMVDKALPLVEDLISLVRDITLSLRPPMLDDLGLLPTLSWHITRYEHSTDITVEFSHQGIERRFDTHVETAAYRVIQEALTNIARHARVDAATVRVEVEDERLRVTVGDRGVGFDPARLDTSTHGLLGMRERLTSLGGGLSIQSQPGSGTTLTAHLPTGDGA